MTEKIITIDEKNYYTYATLEEANEYFAARFGSEWSDLTELQKKQTLITATRNIDKRDYQGEKVDESQHLKFPRIIAGVQTDDNLLIQACCELALNIYSDGGKDTNISNIKSVSMGDSSISFKDEASITSDDDLLIEEYLSDYLMGGVRVIL